MTQNHETKLQILCRSFFPALCMLFIIGGLFLRAGGKWTVRFYQGVVAGW